MEGKLLGEDNPSDPDINYSKIFDDLCPRYLAEGMSYYDYWDGDNDITRYYRKAMKWKLENDNFQLWLQGLYIYNAIGNLSPIFNPFSKKTPQPYIEKPISLTEEKKKEEERKEEKKKQQKGFDKMLRWMNFVNKKKGDKEDG